MTAKTAMPFRRTPDVIAKLESDRARLIETLHQAADAIDDARSYKFDEARKVSEKVRALLARILAE